MTNLGAFSQLYGGEREPDPNAHEWINDLPQGTLGGELDSSFKPTMTWIFFSI